MFPFMGPITTGTPSLRSRVGSRGETGMGWWTTVTPSLLTSRRATCKAWNWVYTREMKPTVK